MGRISFDNYARLAANLDCSDNIVAGRYSFQDGLDQSIIQDIFNKLNLTTSDYLLEIGCGPGNLLIPLSEYVEFSAGIDNAAAVERLNNKIQIKPIKTYVGNFFDIEVQEKYNKVLIYSVMHYLSSVDEVKQFIIKAFDCLSPKSYMLLGDIPNQDKKNRFLDSDFGKLFAENWTKNYKKQALDNIFGEFSKDESMITFTDDVIFDLMKFARKNGFESYLLKQPIELPFSHTREDILFIRK